MLCFTLSIHGQCIHVKDLMIRLDYLGGGDVEDLVSRDKYGTVRILHGSLGCTHFIYYSVSIYH